MTPGVRPSHTALTGRVITKHVLVLVPLLVLQALCLPACFSVTLPTPASPTPGCNGTIERIRTESLPDGMVGQPYSFRLEHNCSGSLTLTGASWGVSGDLPPGIMFGGQLSDGGRFHGTPTVPGNFFFVVSLSACGFVDCGPVIDSRTYSLVVRAAP